MTQKINIKQEAINLRKKGFSYNEILKKIPVAKSTLSLWLRDVGLSKQQKQQLTEKKLAASLKGARIRHEQKVALTTKITNKAKQEIEKISKHELFLICIALYWAEGSKEKKQACNIKFSNSDPRMIKLFLKWITTGCKVTQQNIFIEIYLHKTAIKRKNEIIQYWRKITKIPQNQFYPIRWKKHNPKTNRINVDNTYFGMIRIIVKKSSSFNRQIAGWIEGICQKCGIIKR